MSFVDLWIARFTDGRRLTKWHLCETEIAERRYTRCGRVLLERPGTSLAPLVSPPSSDTTCQQCRR